ncbi:holo-ACP synthase [Chitinimonas sp.]|uniref:holo-ACP synthase n=1 Tax=Chitinimonas sp. TaxID=1934313 RepID=UPI0035B46DC6
MIFGIGTDLIELARIREAYERHGARFATRLLSPGELVRLSQFADPVPYLAKRWAAKEAFAKALGTGIRPPVALAAISVGNDALGKPVFEFDEKVANFLAERHIHHVHLSLSDERSSALAFVVLESDMRSRV